MRLDQSASVIRSKNAGPRKLTCDLIFDDAAAYAHFRARLTELRGLVAQRYGVAENEVRVIDYPPAQAIKLVMDRRIMAGDIGDSDVYGAQQHAPLLGIEL